MQKNFYDKLRELYGRDFPAVYQTLELPRNELLEDDIPIPRDFIRFTSRIRSADISMIKWVSCMIVMLAYLKPKKNSAAFFTYLNYLLSVHHGEIPVCFIDKKYLERSVQCAIAAVSSETSDSLRSYWSMIPMYAVCKNGTEVDEEVEVHVPPANNTVRRHLLAFGSLQNLRIGDLSNNVQLSVIPGSYLHIAGNNGAVRSVFKKAEDATYSDDMYLVLLLSGLGYYRRSPKLFEDLYVLLYKKWGRLGLIPDFLIDGRDLPRLRESALKAVKSYIDGQDTSAIQAVLDDIITFDEYDTNIYWETVSEQSQVWLQDIIDLSKKQGVSWLSILDKFLDCIPAAYSNYTVSEKFKNFWNDYSDNI